MPISQYNQLAGSTFTPLSSQEILMPALMQRERHDKLDEEYGMLNSAAEQIGYLVERTQDPEIRNIYDNYVSSLRGASDQLMQKGVTGQSRRNMLGLKSQFEGQLAPMKAAKDIYDRSLAAQQEAMMKDNTLMIDPNNDLRTKDWTSIYKSGLRAPDISGNISGNELSKQVAQQAQNFKQQLRNNPQLLKKYQGMFGTYAVREMLQYGWDPARIANNPIAQNILNDTLKANNISENDPRYQRAYDYGFQGLYQGIGDDKTDIVKNPDYDFAAKMALQRARQSNVNNQLRLPDMLNLEGNALTNPYSNFQTKLAQGDKEAVLLKEKFDQVMSGNDAQSKVYRDILNSTKGMDTSQRNKWIDDNKDKILKDIGFLEEGESSSNKGPLGVSVGISKQIKDVLNSYAEIYEGDAAMRDIANTMGVSDKNQLNALTNDLLQSKSIFYNDRRRQASESIGKGELNMAEPAKRNIGLSDAVFYENGDYSKPMNFEEARKKYKGEDEFKNILKDSEYVGHSAWNPITNRSMWTFSGVTKSGKHFTIDVPSKDLDQKYSNTKKLNEAVSRSKGINGDRDITIDYNGKNVTGRVVARPDQNGNWVWYFVDKDGNADLVDNLKNIERDKVNQLFADQARTLPMVFKGDPFYSDQYDEED